MVEIWLDRPQNNESQEIFYYNCITFSSIKWQTTTYIRFVKWCNNISERNKSKLTRERESTVGLLLGFQYLKFDTSVQLQTERIIKFSMFSQMKSVLLFVLRVSFVLLPKMLYSKHVRQVYNCDL